MNPTTAETNRKSRSSATAVASESIVQRSCCGAASDPPTSASHGDGTSGHQPAPTQVHACDEIADQAAPPLLNHGDPMRCDAVGDSESLSRHECIAAEAYRIAAQRGFAPGAELDDWLAAEAAVDQRPAGHRPSNHF